MASRNAWGGTSWRDRAGRSGSAATSGCAISFGASPAAFSANRCQRKTSPPEISPTIPAPWEHWTPLQRRPPQPEAPHAGPLFCGGRLRQHRQRLGRAEPVLGSRRCGVRPHAAVPTHVGPCAGGVFLKPLAACYLPVKVVYCNDQGAVPLGELLLGLLQPPQRDPLASGCFTRRGVFKPPAGHVAIAEHRAGWPDPRKEPWPLLVFRPRWERAGV